MNSFGNLFRMHTFGESHGPYIGVVIDGLPAGLPIAIDFISEKLARRKPGQSKITTQRKEDDIPEIVSGIFEGKSSGQPLTILIKNKDQKSKDYGHIKDIYRPSHADYTYDTKWGIRDYRGGGRSSARETANWVAAGAVAELLLKEWYSIKVNAFVSQIGELSIKQDYSSLNLDETYSNIVRCPDAETASLMAKLIDHTRKNRDTIGGIITGYVRNVPVGLGEPVFNKLNAQLGHAILSINACKGFEIGSGFAGASMTGSKHNDLIENIDGEIKTKTNHSGGVQGGISNGEDIYFRAAFKPVATIMNDQESINKDGESVIAKGKGRHDPCVLPRAVPVVEAMTNLVLADLALAHRNSRVSF